MCKYNRTYIDHCNVHDFVPIAELSNLNGFRD